MTSSGVNEFLGNYDYYIEKKNSLLIDDDNDETITKTELKNLSRKERVNTRNRQALRKKLDELEAKIYTIETDIERMELELCSPEVYNNHVLATKTSFKLETSKKDLESLYQDWAILHESQEADNE
jgi:ATP-binding cassette subfamily F protein 3